MDDGSHLPAPGSAHRIVFVHPSDELYGADRMLLEIVAAVPPDVGVEVWLPNDLSHPSSPLCELLEDRGVAVRHLDLPIMRRAYQNPRGLIQLVGRLRRLLRLLQLEHPDAVYCTTSAAFLAAPVGRLAGVPRVMGHVQEMWSTYDRLLIGTLARSCHQLLAISGAVHGQLPARLRRRTVVVPNGTPEPATTETLAGRSGPLRYVVASRWNGWKGHATLLSAWKAAEFPGHLVILGGSPMSGSAVNVAAMVGELGDDDGSVSIPGEVKDPSSYINDADVVLMPSDRPEPFGLVAIEAFARGRPVIASAGGGLVDIVEPGVDGWLFPPGDAPAMAAVFRQLTRPSVELAGERARVTYENRYTTEQFAQRWRQAAMTGWA